MDPRAAQPSPVTPAPPDHARSCVIATAITLALWAVVGVIFAVKGVPPGNKTSDPGYIASLSLLGFAFCSGQGAALTGFMAMKQKNNPLWILPAILGAVLGLAALPTIIGMAVVAGLRKAGMSI